MPVRCLRGRRFGPVPCHVLPSMISAVPAVPVVGTMSCESGTCFVLVTAWCHSVAPLSSVKSSSIQITCATRACGHGRAAQSWSQCGAMARPPGPVCSR